jgi:hypothetical protein
MNKIYIINDYFKEEIELKFNNNTFEKDSVIYKFQINNNNNLNIYWLHNEYETYYTNDSYLYFSCNTRYNNNIIKKYFVINNIYDINQQFILNYENKTVQTLNYNNGNIIDIYDNKIIIQWNDKLIERYIIMDNHTLLINNMEYILNLNNEKTIYIPLHIFIHICCIENWKNIFTEQINKIKDSGLYNIVEKIHLGILGEINNIYDDIFKDEKFDIMYIDKNIFLYEIHTINCIKNFCENNENNEIYILYIHTKGVRRAGNEYVIKSWRNMMEYFLIEKYEKCIEYLNIYDTLGNNVINLYCTDKDSISINKNHTYHYSGNFWWSKKSYIDKLNYVESDMTNNSINTRFRAENWILSNFPNANIGIIYQDNTNTHPYHRFIYNIYKELYFIVKKLI